MLRALLKLFAYSRAPRATFAVLHPVRAVQGQRSPLSRRMTHKRTATAVATALLVGPLAYRLGKRAGEGTLLAPRGERARPVPPPDDPFVVP